jgi:PIN domain nuclease of toxin-antitoxin system
LRILVDSHIFLWAIAATRSLPPEAQYILEDIENTIFVSSATIWELSIKQASGKLHAPSDLAVALHLSIFEHLPITSHHAVVAAQLPLFHKDPFDRMLIAQAKVDTLLLLTADNMMRHYDVQSMIV